MSETIELPGFLSLAKKTAYLSTGEYRLGSVIAKNGRMMAKGFNKYNHMNALAREFFRYSTVHAEIDALFRMDRNQIPGSTIYVFRVRKDGSPGSSLPCYRCLNAMRSLGVRRIVYSTTEYPYYNVQKIE